MWALSNDISCTFLSLPDMCEWEKEDHQSLLEEFGLQGGIDDVGEDKEMLSRGLAADVYCYDILNEANRLEADKRLSNADSRCTSIFLRELKVNMTSFNFMCACFLVSVLISITALALFCCSQYFCIHIYFLIFVLSRPEYVADSLSSPWFTHYSNSKQAKVSLAYKVYEHEVLRCGQLLDDVKDRMSQKQISTQRECGYVQSTPPCG